MVCWSDFADFLGLDVFLDDLVLVALCVVDDFGAVCLIVYEEALELEALELVELGAREVATMDADVENLLVGCGIGIVFIEDFPFRVPRFAGRRERRGMVAERLWRRGRRLSRSRQPL